MFCVCKLARPRKWSETSWKKHKQVTPALVSVIPRNNHQIIWFVWTLEFPYVLQVVIEVNN